MHAITLSACLFTAFPSQKAACGGVYAVFRFPSHSQ